LFIYDPVEEYTSDHNADRGTITSPSIDGDPIAAPIRSDWVAVLPFSSVSQDQEAVILAKGITFELNSMLSEWGLFSVVPHRTVQKFIDSPATPEEIAIDLKVRYLVDGRVQKSLNQARIWATLIDGVTGQSIWNSNRSYAEGNDLDIQGLFARSMGQELDSTMLQSEQERVRNKPYGSLTPFEHYVLAVGVFENQSERAYDVAIRHHRKAIELDPNFALSTGHLSILLHISTWWSPGVELEAIENEACTLANRALVLSNAQANSQAWVIVNVTETLAILCGEADKALEIAQRQLAKHRRVAFRHLSQAEPLVFLNRPDEALQIIDQVEREFSDSYYVGQFAGYYSAMAYTKRLDWQAAHDALQDTLNRHPNNLILVPLLSNALVMLDRSDEARRVWQEFILHFPNFSVENFEWYFTQAFGNADAAKLFTMGLLRAGIGDQ
jgi:TolB-like protein